MYINLFLIGIFLGFSILQLSDYGIAAIIAPIKRLKRSLSGRIDDSNKKTKSILLQTNNSQPEVANDARYYQVFDLNQPISGKNSTGLEEAYKTIKQEMREMKTKIDKYEKLLSQIP